MKNLAVLSLMALFGLLSNTAVAGSARQDSLDRLQNSANVLQEVMAAPDKGIPQDLMDKAKCVVVVPGMKSEGDRGGVSIVMPAAAPCYAPEFQLRINRQAVPVALRASIMSVTCQNGIEGADRSVPVQVTLQPSCRDGVAGEHGHGVRRQGERLRRVEAGRIAGGDGHVLRGLIGRGERCRGCERRREFGADRGGFKAERDFAV